ncbi:adhesion G-protein coupled receptor G6-like isoform X2 [Megalobrama amblycephala]|uniref:adhesion G-protein coupled receptor G6-like isoform X2 n=1 Tax=Megalobrama amblycephala TaxID=75352 RepID=UPI002013E5D8|nr:adhesion G-protein coupled receptor G6-like isoform X2 [Megalobrama amblycephala]
MILFISSRWWRWTFQKALTVFLLQIFFLTTAQSCQSSVSCNVVLTDSQGSFTSPCYPNDYPPSQACKWTIQAPAGFIVQITFLDFELEEAHGCIYDRVVISTGTSDAKFCSSTSNGLTLNSSGNVMEVSFNSDFSVQKKGFHISYKQVAQSCQSSVSCNVVLTDSQGSFTSPCYPNDYPPSQACKWTIQAPAGFIVQITFLDFELEEAHGCIYDRVVISTGASDAKICSSTPNGLTLNSSGNVMEVSFNSDFSVQKKGFHISYKQVAQSCQSSVSCNVVLTDSQGSFTSPCYPNDYPPSQACKWTIQAPAGFIVQITFLDFELEEAHGCIYDRVVISTGTSDAKFCSSTSNGLTLNSSGNVMEVSFNSDFSVQKKGFHISYKQVAVALRSQKVTMPKSSKNIARVSNSISIPALTAFTVCFEIARTAQKSTETIFTLSDAAGTSILAFEKTRRGMELFICGSYCSVNNILTSSDITSSMTPICLTWAKSTGRVAVYFGGRYQFNTCSTSQLYTLQGGDILQLAGKGSSSVSVDDQNLDGFIYNFRLWDYAMLSSELSALTCDVVGNVIDWDHRFWTIPGSYTQTDSTLSCSTAIATLSPETLGCASPGLGCPATLTVTTASIATTNMIPTNATTHAITTTLSYTTTSSMPLTTASVLFTPTTSTKTTTTTTVPTTSPLIQSNPLLINPAAATNSPLSNSKTNA